MQKWFMYVVECNDGTFYTGISTDVNRRVNEHNTSNKGAKYTKTRRPVKLLKVWEFSDRSEASKEEYKFKRLNRKKKLELING